MEAGHAPHRDHVTARGIALKVQLQRLDQESRRRVLRCQDPHAAVVPGYRARLTRDLTQSNRAAGWQDVFHFHVHVIPSGPVTD
jgi:diadenosine tetraphosphate (Ap4A) HIT family hydrolase